MEKDGKSSEMLTELRLGTYGHRRGKIGLAEVGEEAVVIGKLERREASEGKWRVEEAW